MGNIFLNDILIFFLYLYCSQGCLRLPGTLIPTRTTRSGRQFALECAAAKMLSAQGTHTHLDGSQQRHLVYTLVS